MHGGNHLQRTASRQQCHHKVIGNLDMHRNLEHCSIIHQNPLSMMQRHRLQEITIPIIILQDNLLYGQTLIILNAITITIHPIHINIYVSFKQGIMHHQIADSIYSIGL